MKYDEKINQSMEKLEKVSPLFTLITIDKYIAYAKKYNLINKYFTVIDCGYLVYNDQIIFLTSKEGGTILSMNPRHA